MFQVFPLLYNQCGNSDILIAHANSLPNFKGWQRVQDISTEALQDKMGWFEITLIFSARLGSSRVCAHKLISFLLLLKPYLT